MSSASHVRSDIVERLLGAPVLKAEQNGTWSIQRVHLADRSVVAKWVRSDTAGWRSDPAQFATERAAPEFLGGLGLTIVPRLLAADEGTHLLLLEDLHPATALSDNVTPEGLRAFADALGVLHASPPTSPMLEPTTTTAAKHPPSVA